MATSAELMITGLDPDADRFWAAVAQSQIPVQRCCECDARFVLPLPSCPDCASEKLEVIISGGGGELYSWVVVRHAFDEDLASQVPYVVGAVDLDEGARMFARVEGIHPDALAAGTRLTSTFPKGVNQPPVVFVPERGLPS